MLPRKVYSLAQKVREKGHGTKTISHVLMFHDIYEEGMEPKEAVVALSKERFIQLLDKLPRERLGTLDQIGEQGAIILTFDDLYASAYLHAVPQLRKRNIPFVAFVAPGLLDQPDYLNTAQLRDLAADPLCTIAAHSMNHCLMRLLSEKDALWEVQESKRWLEEFCGREVDAFAFPYGSVYACSKSNIRQVAASGFRLGFSTLHCGVTQKDLRAPWFLPRININDSILMKRGL